jgi:hypothetical protein
MGHFESEASVMTREEEEILARAVMWILIFSATNFAVLCGLLLFSLLR